MNKKVEKEVNNFLFEFLKGNSEISSEQYNQLSEDEKSKYTEGTLAYTWVLKNAKIDYSEYTDNDFLKLVILDLRNNIKTIKSIAVFFVAITIIEILAGIIIYLTIAG